MIYTGSEHQDVINILTYINEFSKTIGVEPPRIDSPAMFRICAGIRNDFPHCDGLAKASSFKKVAYFVAHFLFEKPIKTQFDSLKIEGLESFDPNAVVALDIAIICLEKSTINSDRDSTERCISNSIYLSDHSYADIVQALSIDGLCPAKHYHLLAVFFEQLVYKTNRHCEYQPKPKGGYYATPFSVTGGDDLSGV